MSINKPVPLFPSYIELCDFEFEDYPAIDSLFKSNEPWWLEHFTWESLF